MIRYEPHRETMAALLNQMRADAYGENGDKGGKVTDCPFCGEHAVVTSPKPEHNGLFFCFGCGRSGDAGERV